MIAKVTAERLRELLSYDAVTGAWTWLVDRKTGRGSGRVHIKAGQAAGSVCKVRGYVRIGIDGVPYWAHRLAFLWMTGMWPTLTVDHMDGDGSNNAWSNLRDVTHTVNMQNMRRARSDSQSGLLGVSFNRSRCKWVAQIVTERSYKGLGYFDSAEEASAAYLAAKRERHEGNML